MEKYGGPEFFPKNLVISGQSTCKSYGGLKYFHEKIWGSEKLSGKNMGARNSFWKKYGGAKHFLGKLWGCETFVGKIMGVRNFFLFF